MLSELLSFRCTNTLKIYFRGFLCYCTQRSLELILVICPSCSIFSLTGKLSGKPVLDRFLFPVRMMTILLIFLWLLCKFFHLRSVLSLFPQNYLQIIAVFFKFQNFILSVIFFEYPAVWNKTNLNVLLFITFLLRIFRHQKIISTVLTIVN